MTADERSAAWAQLNTPERDDPDADLAVLMGTFRDEDGYVTPSVVDVPLGILMQAQAEGYLGGLQLQLDTDGLPYAIGRLQIGDCTMIVASESFSPASPSGSALDALLLGLDEGDDDADGEGLDG